MFQGFSERIETMYLFRPLLELERGQRFPDYDLVSLAMGVLLFILDNMLQGDVNNCGHEEIRRFLDGTLRAKYGHRLTGDRLAELEVHLLDRLRNGGHQFSYPYRDLETGLQQTISFDIIRLADYDPASGRVRFELTEPGLELLFRTREMSAELRIGVFQLYLRQQVQRGVFDGALGVLDDLRLAVRAQRQRLREFLLQIYRNLREVDPKQYNEEYKATIDLLEREQEEFARLKGLVREETQHREEIVAPTDTDIQALNQLKRIEMQLNRVANAHNQLLAERLSLDNVLLNELRSELQKGFRTSFRAEDELLEPLLQEAELPAHSLELSVGPLLPRRNLAYFNPLRAFARQARTVKSDGQAEELEEVIEGRDPASETRRLRREKYISYLQMLGSLAAARPSFTLAEVIASQPQSAQAQVQRDRDFLQFMLALHQEGVLELRRILSTPDQWLDTADLPLPYLVVRAFEESGQGLPARILIEESSEELDLGSGNRITNLVFQSAGA